MEIRKPYLLFLGDVTDPLAVKVARGLTYWRPAWCIGQLRLKGCTVNVALPDMTFQDAAKCGSQTMVIGVVNAGGHLPEHWVKSIVAALDAGFDVVGTMHRPLSSAPAVREAAERNGRTLHEARLSDRDFTTGTGAPRSGRRLLTVGTDCSVGKKYTALSLERALRGAGFDVDFRATGQTGVLISERGLAIDAVRGRLYLGGRRVADTRCRLGALGRYRRPRFTVPSILRRDHPRPPPRIPARRVRGVHGNGPHADAPRELRPPLHR